MASSARETGCLQVGEHRNTSHTGHRAIQKSRSACRGWEAAWAAEPGFSTTCLRPGSPGRTFGAASGPLRPSPPPRHPPPFSPSPSLLLSAGLPPSPPFLIIFILAHLGGIYARSGKRHKRPRVTCVLRPRPESLRRRRIQQFQKAPGLRDQPPSLPLAAASHVRSAT